MGGRVKVSFLSGGGGGNLFGLLNYEPWVTQWVLKTGF